MDIHRKTFENIVYLLYNHNTSHCAHRAKAVKLSPGDLKKIIRAVIEVYINNYQVFPFSVNLFGSTDKHTWYLLNASNVFGSRRELLIGRSTYSCRYYILVISGKIDEEAYFSHIDVGWEERYGNISALRYQNLVIICK